MSTTTIDERRHPEHPDRHARRQKFWNRLHPLPPHSPLPDKSVALALDAFVSRFRPGPGVIAPWLMSVEDFDHEFSAAHIEAAGHMRGETNHSAFTVSMALCQGYYLGLRDGLDRQTGQDDRAEFGMDEEHRKAEEIRSRHRERMFENMAAQERAQRKRML